MAEPPPNGLRYKVEDHERRLSNLERSTSELGVIKERVEQVRQKLDSDVARRMDTMDDELTSLRRALYTAALSVSGGALIFAATIFAVFR